MKRLFALVSVIMLAGTLAACNTEDTENVEGTLLSLDINPSVEFIVDEDGEIDSYTPLNEDGEIVLADLDLEGMNYEEALDLYLEEATELGYIDVNADDNAVYISTNEDDTTDEADPDQDGDTEDENTEDENTDPETVTDDAFDFDEGSLEDRVKDKVNEHFESRGIMGAAVKKDLEEEYGDIAEEYDIGLGKARLLSRAVELDEELTMEEAVEMNMGDVMAILRADHQERMEEFRNNRSEEAQAFKNEMKEQVKDRVQAHRDESDENGEDGEDVDFDAVRERIRNRTGQDETDHSERMNDIKDKARGKMGGNNPFSDDSDETEEDEDASPDETPDNVEE